MTNKQIIYAVALGLLGCSLPLNAQKLYTLDECQALAVENSAKVKNSRFDVEAAEQTSKEAFTNYFPNISATGAIFKASESMAQMDMALPVPGVPPISMEMLKSGKMAGVTLLQPVFMGGRIVNGNKLAHIGEQVSQYQLALTEDQVEASVSQYFWQIVALKEKLRTLATLETQLDTLHRDVVASVDAGVTTRNDLLRVELQQQNIAANRLKVENGLSVTRMLLCQLIGVDKSDFDIAFDNFPPVVSPLDYYIDPETGVFSYTRLDGGNVATVMVAETVDGYLGVILQADDGSWSGMDEVTDGTWVLGYIETDDEYEVLNYQFDSFAPAADWAA